LLHHGRHRSRRVLTSPSTITASSLSGIDALRAGKSLSGRPEKTRFGAGRRDPFDRLPIEGGKHCSAEPAPFKGDDPVGEISARFQHRQRRVTCPFAVTVRVVVIAASLPLELN
jgi:hypothetical protein